MGKKSKNSGSYQTLAEKRANGENILSRPNRRMARRQACDMGAYEAGKRADARGAIGYTKPGKEKRW
jgi:hypothetical protein